MAKLRLLELVRRELKSIQTYSEQEFSWPAAERYMRGIDSMFGLLERHPQSGASVPYLSRPTRVLSYRRHCIFYQVDGQHVVVLRILHHTMDATRWLG